MSHAAWRVFSWLGIVGLAICAYWFDSDFCRAISAFSILALIAFSAPRGLRLAVLLVALVAATTMVFGGIAHLLDALPALIAGLIAWVFLRSLRHGHTPLIARAISAIDGPEYLDDPQVAAYARRLTWVWALYQSALTAIAALLAMRMNWLALPAESPRIFGAIILPLAVAILFVGEFFLRRWILPQAPQHSLFTFLRGLVRVWPSLLGD
jgi:uncharacterized membrane protein